MKKRFTEEQIIGILRQAEIDGVVIRDLCRKHNITEQTFFRWRNKYNGYEFGPFRWRRLLAAWLGLDVLISVVRSLVELIQRTTRINRS
jgi:hypothetical protein